MKIRSLNCERKILRSGGNGWQLLNGSPVKSSGQEHAGVWWIILQIAPNPQEPGHGSLHFSFMHALLLGQSGFMVHSGLQFGGLPM